MEYINVLDVSELPAGQMAKVTVKGEEILLANVEGSFYALANTCTHLGGSLANGELAGSVVTCPRHGARFNVRTGQAVGDARVAVLKMKVKDVVVYPVKVDGTAIMVGVPD